MAILGLFRGFSGTLAFFLALAAACFCGVSVWPYFSEIIPVTGLRGIIVLLVLLVVFGCVRLFVKKCVHVLLAQPTDAAFGALVGIAIGALLVVSWARLDIYSEYSFLVQISSSYVR